MTRNNRKVSRISEATMNRATKQTKQNKSKCVRCPWFVCAECSTNRTARLAQIKSIRANAERCSYIGVFAFLKFWCGAYCACVRYVISLCESTLLLLHTRATHRDRIEKAKLNWGKWIQCRRRLCTRLAQKWLAEPNIMLNSVSCCCWL